MTSTTFTGSGNASLQYITAAIIDPVTSQQFTFQTPSLYGAPGSVAAGSEANGIWFSGHGYQDVLFTNEQYFVGFATYDPAQGQWKSFSSSSDLALVISFKDGVGAYISGRGNLAGYTLTLATYDPSVGNWVTTQLLLTGNPGLATYPYYGITSSGGMLYAWYNDANAGDQLLCAIYDPLRKAWMTMTEPINRNSNGGGVSNANGALSYNPGTITPPNAWEEAYSFSAGSWVSNQNAVPLSMFYVQKSYSASYPNTRWVTDMSYGSARALNWGDGTLSSTGGGYRNYASTQQFNITQSVNGWHNDTPTLNATINVPPTVSTTVDGWARGQLIQHAAGDQPTLTVHFSASSGAQTLKAPGGIRYNALNATTGWMDNGGAQFVPQAGSSGSVTKSITLADGIWYFWTDAQDSWGISNTDGPWNNGYKIIVDTPPVPAISVDGYSSGAQIYHNYGQGVTVTVHYNATAPDSNLSGIRYNIWNSSTNYFDSGGGGFVAESGASGQYTKTFTLTDDGDWYFWTDAQDSFGGYASTGAWGSGFKITLIQNGQPAQTPSPSARLVNLSIRAPAGTGSNTLIGGFILSGGAAEPILINGKGPSMIPMGLDGLANPNINLYQGSTVIASNDNWGSASNAAQISATGLAPTNSLESSIYQALNPTGYTVLMGNSGSGTIGMLELNDMNGGSSAQLVNISGRAYIGTGNSVVIAGFIISGGPKRVLINGKGPSLAAMGVSGVITDPTLTLYNSSGPIQSNNNWQTAWNASAISGTGLGPTDAHEAAIDEVLPAGVYTVILSGYNSATGVGMVEIDGL